MILWMKSSANSVWENNLLEDTKYLRGFCIAKDAKFIIIYFYRKETNGVL